MALYCNRLSFIRECSRNGSCPNLVFLLLKPGNFGQNLLPSPWDSACTNEEKSITPFVVEFNSSLPNIGITLYRYLDIIIIIIKMRELNTCFENLKALARRFG
ncbi:hypothetical protein ACF0H5_012003 [Mactra antiquata]